VTLGRPVPWHLIGHLQTNKVRPALELFDVIHSVDRLELARECDRRAKARGQPVTALLQVNVGGEVSKGGFAPEQVAEAIEAVGALDHVKLCGLMAIPPPVERAEDARGWFRTLAQLAKRHGVTELSMGMSADYEGGHDGAGGHRDLRAPGGASRAMSLKGRTVGFVGSGNMGEALIRGLVVANVVPAKAVWASDVRGDRLEELERKYGIQRAPNNPELVRQVDVAILAIKPQIMAAVLREIAPAVTKKKLLISLAAGVSTARLRAGLAREVRLIRVMPNTPALVLDGATAIAKAEGLEPDDLTTASEIFSAVGRVVVLEEELMDAVTGLSGSGPAYVALVIESLADGGVKMGLDRITAMALATQTVLGAARLLLETGMHPGALKDMVSSPGGTSIAGISALEEGGIRTTFIKAVERATQRSKELGQGPA
jgi:pyrroline-5-carboxylate reductase